MAKGGGYPPWNGEAMFRYARLEYVALNVTNLERSRTFYETLWGLQPAGHGAEGELFLRCGDKHHDVILYPSTHAGLKRLGWLLESEREIDRAAAHLATFGVSARDVPAAESAALGVGRSIRAACPITGLVHEFFAAATPAETPFVKTVTAFDRLGHVIIRTPEYEKAVAFYQDAFNMRSSDEFDGRVTFMRCFPNPFHHSFGVAKSERNGLHHVCFMVPHLDDLGRGFWRLKKNDVPIVFGPGRHPPSTSNFLYVLDPDGMTVEYSYGMEEFPEIDPRPSRVFPLNPDTLDHWGAVMDPRMAAAGDIEQPVATSR
jgi:2,3-dihydroxy-p-cumate/2,3-dihydroxybenzoate 3,4-dioxygenase